MEDDEESGGGAGGWIVSFADLMTLLFAAFVVLYGLITQGTAETQMGVKAEIRSAFVEITESISPDHDLGTPKPGQFYFKAHYGETARPTSRSDPKDEARAAFDRDKNMVKNFVDSIKLPDGKEELRFRDAFNVDQDDEGLTIRLAGAYFFEPGKFQLKPIAVEKFVELGTFLKTMDRTILIEGHADGGEAKGQYSLHGLSTMRAAQAAHILRERCRFPVGQIETLGYGVERLLDRARPEKNRRIELKIRYRR